MTKGIRRLNEFFLSLLQVSRDWCANRRWHLRLLLWLYLFFVFICQITGSSYQQGIFAPLNLCIHELGHFVFAFFGHFIYVLGGTILQCLVPIIGIIMFYHQRDFFAISVALCWLATNLYGVAVYIADARAMEMILVSPFGSEGQIHDWNYILGKLGLLNMDTTIALLTRILGFFTMLTGLVYGGWLIYQIFQTERNARL